MPRAIWSGAISFGLLNVPVRMFSAIQDHRLHFNYIHEPDGGRIGYQKICKAEDEPVEESEIVKAFDWDGELIPMRDEDFEAAKVETHRRVEIRDFVDYDEIDPIFFERTYYLAPDEGAEHAYNLLVRAMEEDGRAAIAKFVMRDRQHLGCIRVRDGLLALERMHFADEVRSVDELRPESEDEIPERELEMARRLIDSFAADFEPERYEDSYRDTLCEIIEAKRGGEAIRPPEPKEPERAPDLMAALEQSLAEVSAGDGRNRGSNGANGAGRDGLEGLSKDELYERAKRADIAGRSEMSKEELVSALTG